MQESNDGPWRAFTCECSGPGSLDKFLQERILLSETGYENPFCKKTATKTEKAKGNILPCHNLSVATQYHTRGSFLHAIIVSICTGHTVRHELSVFCEDTRVSLTVVSKPLAGLKDSALLCTFMGSSGRIPRYEYPIYSVKTHELVFEHQLQQWLIQKSSPGIRNKTLILETSDVTRDAIGTLWSTQLLTVCPAETILQVRHWKRKFFSKTRLTILTESPES